MGAVVPGILSVAAITAIATTAVAQVIPILRTLGLIAVAKKMLLPI